MKFTNHVIAGACLAACSVSSFAATAVCPTTLTTPADGAAAEVIVKNCAPAATLFIGGASTQSSNLLLIANAQLFDSAFTPIQIQDNVTTSKANVKAFVGKAKAGIGGLGGKLIYVVYNFNNGSAGGVSQLLGKTPKLADQAIPAKAIPEADVPFVGPAKDATTPDTKTANAFCGTAATTVTSTASLVACNSHTTQTADMALSDVRAQELYAVYEAAAKGKVSTLTQVPLALQSFGVAVSPLLYSALQTKQGLVAGDQTAANQPSIKSADYASLVSKGGKVDSLAALVGDASLAGQSLTLARRDDLSGSQAASNIFFVNGQCGGNDLAAVAKSIDQAVAKAGGLLGGLAIRSTTDSVAGQLVVQANVTSTDVRTALNAGGYAIGVLGTGGGGAQGAAGQFVKIDGVSPNFDGTNFRNATATRAQIVGGAYPFAYTLFGMYVTKTMADAKNADKKAMVNAMISGFKDSNLSNLSGFGYLDGGVAAKQTAYSRENGNNCSPITKL